MVHFYPSKTTTLPSECNIWYRLTDILIIIYELDFIVDYRIDQSSLPWYFDDDYIVSVWAEIKNPCAIKPKLELDFYWLYCNQIYPYIKFSTGMYSIVCKERIVSYAYQNDFQHAALITRGVETL